MSFNETFQWVFSGLNVNVARSYLDSIGIIIQFNKQIVQSESQCSQTQEMVADPEIIIYNSSFSSLDLKPGSKAQITDCYFDAQFKPRPTLITANNSDVSVQNCHFGNFINENGSTVLYGHYCSHVIIENTMFT